MTLPRETATGMRQTREKKVIPIPIARSVKKETLKQTLSLPQHFLQKEPPRTRDRASDLWENRVLKTMSELIRTRKSRSMNKHMRRVVFSSGMEKLVAEFNRSTENIKVDFQEHNKIVNREPTTTYSLQFCLLTPIPESVRNAPSCTAEIVRLEQERIARAQLVDLVAESGGAQCSSTECVVTEILGANGGIQPQRRRRAEEQHHMPLHAMLASPVATSEAIPMAVAVSVDDNSIITCSTEECHTSSDRSWREPLLSRRGQNRDVAGWSNDQEEPVATAVICEVLEPEG